MDPGLLAAFEPLERALLDAHRGTGTGEMTVLTDAGDEDPFPAALLLRGPDALLPLDRAAVGLAMGRVLDVGAGGGSLSLALQAAGLAVTALDILPGARRVMAERGVRDVRDGDAWSFRSSGGYETVAVLMNGAGLAGTLDRLTPFLGKLAAFLEPGGQILLDSTDPGPEDGELHYQLVYQGVAGAPFPYLLVAPADMDAAARSVGLACEVVAEDGESGYLARLTTRPLPPPGPGPGPTPPRRPRIGS